MSDAGFAAAVSENGLIVELERAAKLFSDGLLNRDEFARLKAQVSFVSPNSRSERR